MYIYIYVCIYLSIRNPESHSETRDLDPSSKRPIQHPGTPQAFRHRESMYPSSIYFFPWKCLL